jgi:tetratricopeptide (TPR) repeat protein
MGRFRLTAHRSRYPDLTIVACVLAVIALFATALAHGQCQPIEDAAKPQPSVAQHSPSGQPEFFDEPQFTVAGVTDVTNLGGHGSNTVLRTKEALAKDVVSLGAASAIADTKIADEKAADAKQTKSSANPSEIRAEVEERQGNPLEALREYQRAAETNPSESNYFNWGAELLVHRAAEPAIEVFSKGAHLFPQSARMRIGLGVAAYAGGSYDQAARRLCEASDLNQDDPNPYLFLGKIQSVEIEPSEGLVQRLERFARLHPENAQANYYYALGLWKQRKNPDDPQTLAQMEALLRRSVQIDPSLGVGYLQLGVLYAERKDFPGAVSYYEKAVKASPQLEEAHYRLAQAYKRTGEKEKAEQEVQLFNEISRKKDEDAERERRESRQFVYTLREPAATPQPR